MPRETVLSGGFRVLLKNLFRDLLSMGSVSEQRTRLLDGTRIIIHVVHNHSRNGGLKSHFKRSITNIEANNYTPKDVITALRAELVYKIYYLVWSRPMVSGE